MVQVKRTIDFHELRALTSVVRHGGISAAAQALGLSKSTISMQITRLEARFGVRLVERTSRRVALTREGEQLLPRVQSILAEADHLFDEALGARTSPRGTVRIAVPPALGGALLEQLVPALAERYPDIALVVAPSYDMDDVQDPAFDFAVRVGQVSDEGLVATVIGSFARILVCSPDCPAAPSGIAMLGEMPLLAFSGTSTHIDWRLCRAYDSEKTSCWIVRRRSRCAISSCCCDWCGRGAGSRWSRISWFAKTSPAGGSCMSCPNGGRRPSTSCSPIGSAHLASAGSRRYWRKHDAR